jgi:hypothetical protein
MQKCKGKIFCRNILPKRVNARLVWSVLQKSVHSTKCNFFVDNSARLHQYLVCKQVTAPFIGLQSEIGSKDLNSSRRHSTHGNQEKSSQEKEEKVVQSRSQVSVKFKQGKIVMTGVRSEHPFYLYAAPQKESMRAFSVQPLQR